MGGVVGKSIVDDYDLRDAGLVHTTRNGFTEKSARD